MMSSSFSGLDQLAARLPFSLDATDEVNAVFARWRDHATDEDEELVAIWTYCFVLRYFLVKAVRGSIIRASDLDMLITKAYRRIGRNQDTVNDPSRYASWVSVVCKNTFINYVRRRRDEHSIEVSNGPVLRADQPVAFNDVGFMLHALEQAIARLPEYLQETARLYFVRGCTYEEISEAIGKPVPTVRTYRHKVVERFREDASLICVLRPDAAGSVE